MLACAIALTLLDLPTLLFVVLSTHLSPFWRIFSQQKATYCLQVVCTVSFPTALLMVRYTNFLNQLLCSQIEMWVRRFERMHWQLLETASEWCNLQKNATWIIIPLIYTLLHNYKLRLLTHLLCYGATFICTTSLWRLRESGSYGTFQPSLKIAIRSSLLADFTFIRTMCDEKLIEKSTAADGVFILVLRGLHTLGEDREALLCLDWVNVNISLSEKRI